MMVLNILVNMAYHGISTMLQEAELALVFADILCIMNRSQVIHKCFAYYD